MCIRDSNQGNIWAGTDGKGIFYKEIFQMDSLLVDKKQIRALKKDPRVMVDTVLQLAFKNHSIDKRKGLLSNWIGKVQVVGNDIWVASYSSGIAKLRYDPQRERIRSQKKFTQRNGIRDLQIRDMQTDPDGKIWYATQNGHLGYIDRNRVTHLDNVLNKRVAIKTLLFHKNILFLGTAGRGIWWSNIEGDLEFRKLKGKKRPYSDNIYQMIFDNAGNLWVGNERGVDKIELNQSNEIVDVFHFGRNDGFLGIETCLNAVTKDDLGNLWFGAIHGLTKYQPTETTKKTIKPSLHFENLEVAYQSVDSIQFSAWTNNLSLIHI